MGTAQSSDEVLEPLPALAQRQSGEGVSPGVDQKVEHQQRGRGLGRKSADAALGRMDALEQIVELELVVAPDDDFAVEHEAGRRQRNQRLDKLGKVAGKGLTALGLQRHHLRVSEGQAAEAVPFRLIEPAVAPGERRPRLCLHRGIRWRDRQRQGRKAAVQVPGRECPPRGG